MFRLMFFIALVISATALAGPAIAVGLLLLAAVALFARWTVWSAARRNRRERELFELVNTGQAEVHPGSLAHIWR